MSNILVSIVIPTYNDWGRLSLCIDALSKQSFANERFEVIIVNNNTNDSAPADFKLPNGKIIVEQRPGSYAARNAALRIAKGDIIGFTDSDCIPDENWIKSAVDYLNNNPGCSRIGGMVSVFCKSVNSTIELYDKLYAFNQKSYVERSGACVTANLFTYRHVFDKVGYFNDSLMSGGDFLWGEHAHKNGYKIEYVENVIVKHPARNNLKQLLKKERRVGGSQARFLNGSNSTILNLLNFLKEILPRRSDIRFIYSRGRDLTTINKIYIYLIRQYLLGVRAYAKLEVQMGKKPTRD